MKNLISFIFVVLFFCDLSYSQIKIEVGGGYIHTLNRENLFTHNGDGAQGYISVLFPVSGLTDLTGKFVYQSRRFDKKSFSFVVPHVVGYPVPYVTDGENLKSYGLFLGAKFFGSRNLTFNSYLASEVGLITHSGSYLELNKINRVKYSDSKTLFEYSVGIGLNIKLSDFLSFNIDGRVSHVPSAKVVYFPVNMSLQMPFN